MLSPDAFSNDIEDNVSPAGLGFSFAFSAAAAAAASAACFAASAALEMIDGHYINFAMCEPYQRLTLILTNMNK